MNHSIYIVSSTEVKPENLVWQEPIAWDKDGDGTHFKTHKAFISKTNILGGFRYCVRACTLRCKPPEIPE